MLESVVVWAAYLLVLLFCLWLARSVNSGFRKDYARQDKYFTPRMKAADQQLQALSKRLGAEYVRGVVEWRSFATPWSLATTEVNTPPHSVWGGGSLVRKVIDGYEIEVTYGVQTFVPHERGGRTSWEVFVPRFTAIAARPIRSLNRFDVYWSSDEEVLGATGRGVYKALTVALPFVSPTLPMPPDVERAHAILAMDAAQIRCDKDRIEATGRPKPRARGETREFGQGDFSIESMSKMIERTLALVRTLEKA